MPNTFDGRKMRRQPNGRIDARDNILANHAPSRAKTPQTGKGKHVGRPSRSVPHGWPRWPVRCHGTVKVDWYNLETGENIRPKGTPCKAWAVLGSDYCRFHGGWALKEETRMKRYLIFVLTGIVVEKPVVNASFDLVLAAELEAIIDKRRPEIRPRVREDILLAAFRSGIIHP